MLKQIFSTQELLAKAERGEIPWSKEFMAMTPEERLSSVGHADANPEGVRILSKNNLVHCAVKSGKIDTVKFALSVTSSNQLFDRSRTCGAPSDLAKEMGHHEVVSLLASQERLYKQNWEEIERDVQKIQESLSDGQRRKNNPPGPGNLLA